MAEDAGSPLHLVGPADVDHLADPKVMQHLLRGDRELVESIGPEERPPAGLPPNASGIAANVTQVTRAWESEMPIGEHGSVGNVGGHEPEGYRIGRRCDGRSGRATPAPPRSGWPGHGAGPA